ncbi:MAG: hypothetical protein NTZ80_02520 [Patescibacteria group bacterium]|nr:hypothetical protein [Patescibacteria group bacterium]
MSYIRKYKRGESTYVQLIFKEGRKITKIIHLGTAHNQIELDLLLTKASQLQISSDQLSLFPVLTQKQGFLTIVLASIAVAKIMEEKSKFAIKKIVKLIKPLRTGILINEKSGVKLEIEPLISDECVGLIQDLSRGY